ncbi:MAG: HD domain-containing protein [Candidatus Omnitrophica bacterium]|nr:HD domain-containing protein [Candidatus Omnitrophota bacterium]
MTKKPFSISKSIEDESLIRKFSVIFLVISLLPTLVLFYFYTQLSGTGSIQVSVKSLNFALTFIVLGVLLGYGTMRRIIKNLIDLVTSNKKILERILSPQKLKEMGSSKNEISILTHSFIAITSELEENVRELQLAKNTIYDVMNKVAKGMANMDQIETFLDLILETVTEAMSGQKGYIVRLELDSSFKIHSAHGVAQDINIDQLLSPDDITFIREVLKSKKVDIRTKDDVDWAQKFKSGIFELPFICAPLVKKDDILGVLIVSGRKMARDFDADEGDLMAHLAAQTAIAIENSRLNKDIEQTYFETISALALAVDAKDQYSRGHLDRVADCADKIGVRMGLEDNELKLLRDAARLHDLGKIGIPDDVLGKGSQLSVEEWVMMRKHPEIGESIIKPVRTLLPLCDLIRHHHEKLDGSGYPDGLKGNDVTPLVRIMAVADIYDAVTTDRSYRKKITPHEACNILRSMGSQLDQDVVDILAEIVEE